MFVSRFTSDDGPGPDLWTVREPLIWQDRTYGHLEVPAGFVTDLASIPRAFRNLPWLDPNGLSRRPAVVHDWLYGSDAGRRYGKQFADSFLRAALIAEGATQSVASSFYYAVHWFGGSSWDDDGVRLARPRLAP